jgi:hypothetical protein
MNRKTFLIAASVSFIAAVLTSGVARMEAPNVPLYLIHPVALR